jgi:hypothetical protein
MAPRGDERHRRLPFGRAELVALAYNPDHVSIEPSTRTPTGPRAPAARAGVAPERREREPGVDLGRPRADVWPRVPERGQVEHDPAEQQTDAEVRGVAATIPPTMAPVIPPTA